MPKRVTFASYGEKALRLKTEVETVVVDVKADDTVILRVAAKPHERLMPSKTWKRMVSESDKTLRVRVRSCMGEEDVYKIKPMFLFEKMEGKNGGRPKVNASVRMNRDAFAMFVKNSGSRVSIGPGADDWLGYSSLPQGGMHAESFTHR